MTTPFSTFGEAFQLSTELPLVVFNPHRQKVPIKLWLRDLDDQTREQIMNLAQLEVVRGHVAIMPDAHMGIGCSVGTVFATVDAVVPSTVGVDLGCGMMAVRFPGADADQLAKDRSVLERLHRQIREIVPTGFAGHTRPQRWDGFKDFPLNGVQSVQNGKETDFEALAAGKAREQLGSLGGGNHFIELCLDSEDNVWLMLHSGSRGIGNLIGTHFIHRARNYCNAINAKRPKDLDWLPIDHPEGRQYLAAVEWAQAYARENRHHMMRSMLEHIKSDPKFSRLFFGDSREPLFTVENHHNFVQKEQHFGETVWVHRKGAVSAQAGEWGILPGSMATGSYIVRGKGNEESLCSCAHGSGRKMSRNAAKRQIPLEQVEKAMRGIVGEPARDVHDEAPQAYKDLETVMHQQEDLIEQAFRLRPLLNVKGY